MANQVKSTSSSFISNEIRVGIMFLTGLILLIMVIMSVNRWGQTRDTYSITVRFNQAQGIQEGADVRIAGVKVGRVTAVGFDSVTNEALVVIRVAGKVDIYSKYGYAIGLGGLVGERFLEIIPRSENRGELIKAGGTVSGTVTPDMNDLIVNTNNLISKLSETSDTINEVMGGPENKRNLQKTIANLNSATLAASQFTRQLNQLMARNSASVDLLVANLTDVSRDIRAVSDSISPQLKNSEFVANLDTATANVASMTARLDNLAAAVEVMIGDKQIAGDLKDTIKNLKIASADLGKVMANAKDATKDLPAITANLQKASADLPEITKPFKDVAPNIACNLQEIVERLNDTSKEIYGVAGQVSKAGANVREITFKPQATFMYTPNGTEDIRTDLNVDIRRKRDMIRLGIAELGGNNTINLQYGNRIGENNWLRYGIVQSQLGIGYDAYLNPNLNLTGELFNPNDLSLNALLNYRLRPLGKDWWLTTGGYNIFSSEDQTLGIGLTYKP